MKTIKLNFIGFWSNFNKNDNLFTNILKEKFNVQISDNPDFLIISPLCSPYEYTKYTCVRILFTGEPLSPDFNVFDYAISFDYITCLDSDGCDRHFRYPLCFSNYKRVKENTLGLTYEAAKKELAEKNTFATLFMDIIQRMENERKYFPFYKNINVLNQQVLL